MRFYLFLFASLEFAGWNNAYPRGSKMSGDAAVRFFLVGNQGNLGYRSLVCWMDLFKGSTTKDRHERLKKN